jgi:hypothetical protein
MKKEQVLAMFPEVTDGVTVFESYARDLNQHYAIELECRNAEDLADWLLEHNLTQEQHSNLLNMLRSNDKESQVLALELIKVKKQQANEATGYIHGN